MLNICSGRSETLEPFLRLAEVMGLTYAWSTMRSLCWSLAIMQSKFLSYRCHACLDYAMQDLYGFHRPLSEVVYDLRRLLIEDKHLVLRNLFPLNGT